MTATTDPFRPTTRNRVKTRTFRSALEGGRVGITVDGTPFTLPGEIEGALVRAVEFLASGEPVLVIPASEELTTGEAAEIIGCSRQYLVRLLDQGRIPYRREGTHRRLLLRDVIRYREKARREQEAAMRDLIRQSEELGAYDATEADDRALDETLDRDRTA